MKTLVVYDSVYGNTRQVAEAIGAALPGDVSVLHAGSVGASALEGVDLLIVGAPTHGGRPTESPQAFLDGIEAKDVAGKRVAGFDTRLTARWVRIFGYAAPRIVEDLEGKGGIAAGPPGDFYVKGRRGPLVAGELERAADWARRLVATR